MRKDIMITDPTPTERFCYGTVYAKKTWNEVGLFWIDEYSLVPVRKFLLINAFGHMFEARINLTLNDKKPTKKFSFIFNKVK